MSEVIDIELDQLVETRLSEIRSSRWHLRYAFCPSQESREAANLGQDALRVKMNDTRLAFCLCDGVGQSFFGNLAATSVSRWLVDTLWQFSSLIGEDTTSEAMTERFHQSLPEIARLIDDYQIPEDTPTTFAEVLEEMRQHGSETMFVAGALQVLPDGGGEVMLTWMGDCRLRVFDRRAREIKLPNCPSDTQRWSSRRGLLADWANVANGKSRSLGRLLLYSDGLDLLDGRQEILTSEEMQETIDRARDTPGSDDLSLLEIHLMQVGES